MSSPIGFAQWNVTWHSLSALLVSSALGTFFFLFNQQNPTSARPCEHHLSKKLSSTFHFSPYLLWNAVVLSYPGSSSCFVGSPVIEWFVSEYMSASDAPWAPWSNRACFSVSLLCPGGTMHKLWVVFHHLPRECSVCFNKVVLKNQSALKYIKWKLKLLFPLWILRCLLWELMPLLPEVSLYKHKCTDIHLLVDRFLWFFPIVQVMHMLHGFIFFYLTVWCGLGPFSCIQNWFDNYM